MIVADPRVPESHIEVNVALHPWLTGSRALTLIVPPTLGDPVIILNHSTLNTARMMQNDCSVLNGQTLIGAYTPQENFRGRGLVIEVCGSDPGPVFAPVAIMVELKHFEAMELGQSGWEFEQFWRTREEGVSVSIPEELAQAMGFRLPQPSMTLRQRVRWLWGILSGGAGSEDEQAS